MRILVTGGVGYIGGHFCCEALQHDHKLYVIDYAVDDRKEIVDAIRQNAKQPEDIVFFNIDLRNSNHLANWFKVHHDIDAVVHFAAFKDARASVPECLEYYDNNVRGSIHLINQVAQHKIKKFLFSSTAAVYAPDAAQPCLEDSKLGPIAPYGKSKLMVETMLSDFCVAYPDLSAVALRYFNVAGSSHKAFKRVLMTEENHNLFSMISKVAHHQLEHLSIYGDDYATRDGTGIRDYIHVLDLIEAHLLALDYMQSSKGFEVFNLGLGSGCTVLEMVDAYERVNDVTIKKQMTARQPGDSAEVYASPKRAEDQLNWHPKRGLTEIVKDK